MKKIFKNIHFFIFISATLFLASCVKAPQSATDSAHSSVDQLTNDPPIITSIKIATPSTIEIKGKFLDDIRNAKLTQSSNIYDLPIISKSKNTLTLAVASNVKLAVDLVSTLLISNSFGQASTPITFVINDNSISTAKIVDKAVTSAKLDDMNAASGDVLLFDGTNWGPGNVSGLSYSGTYIPMASTPPTVTPTDGDFYLVSMTISNVDIDGAGATPIRSYAAGDWLVYNATTAVWDQIASTSSGNFLSKSGNDLYYTAGRLSLGINTPTSSVLTLGENSLMGTYSGEMIALTGSDVTNGAWSRSMSFGINATKMIKMGGYGTSAGGTPALDYFFIDTTGSLTPWTAAKFVISSGGFVGINNIAPTEELDVTGTIKATNFSGDGSLLTGIVATDGLTNITSTTVNADSDANGSGQMLFQIGGSTVGMFENNGNFGLGTTSPAEKLSVVGNAIVSGNLSVLTNVDITGNAAVAGNLSSVGNVAAQELYIGTDLIYTDSFISKVGINTATPLRTLDIDGELKVNCIYDADNSTQIGGTCSSDARFKKNVEEVDDLNSKFSNLRLVSYDWDYESFPNKNFSKKRALGFIAQEVQKEFPELVEVDKDGMYKLNYTKLQLYSVGVVAKQAQEIEALKDENNQMKEFLCQKYQDAPFCK